MLEYISDEVLRKAQEKIGTTASNVAQSHTLGMIETCQQLAALNPDKVATLDVVLLLRVKRSFDGKFTCGGRIKYVYQKRVNDAFDEVTLFDPNPDLPGMENETSEETETSAPSDESDVVEPDVVDEPEQQDSPEPPQESDLDRPALPPAPKLLEAAPEKAKFTVTREAFIARLTSLPKPHELMKNEVEKFLNEVIDFDDLSPELVLNVMSDRESLENLIKDIKTELYTRHDPEPQKSSEPENESQESPKKKRGRKPKNAPAEPAPTPQETPETAQQAPDLPLAGDDMPPAVDDASDAQEMPSDAERCERHHPSGVRCCLKKGHEGNCCMTPEDRAIADEWEKKNRKK